MGFLINGLIYILSYNFKKFIGFSLPVSDIIIYLIMIVIVFFKVMKYNKLDNKEKRNFYINLLPILGVIGTFLGICLGLANFNSNEIESSVPQLLQGLKTAFWTSFIGTSWAVFLNIRYSSKDREDNEEDEISLLKLQIEELKKLNNNFYNLVEENKIEKNLLYQLNKEMLENIKANNSRKENLLQLENLKNIKDEIILLNQKQDSRDEILNNLKLILEDINSLKESLNLISNKFENLKEISNSQLENLKKIEDYTFVLDDIYNSLDDLKVKADSQINQLENLEKLNILDEIKNNIDSQLEDISVTNSNISTKLNKLIENNKRAE
nr:MotA/TolQ/ExbB proton channel family protein [uncultured Fusobacterium sp.]